LRVLLISTYELGRQPFGLASPAACIGKDGHDVQCVDTSRTPLTAELIRNARLIAFYLPMHTATRLAAPLIQAARRINPDAHLCGYGLYAPLNAAYLRGLGLETLIGGEFEESLRRLASASPVPADLVSLDRIPFSVPDRSHLPPLGGYAKLIHGAGERVTGYTEASRGCKHLCRHCPVVPVYQGAFRIVPAEIVLADIANQAAAGARHITFGDPDFFNGPTHAIRIVEELHRQHPHLTYDVTIKVEHLLRHRDLLPTLHSTGCLLITSAAESVDDDILLRLNKGHTRADFLEAVRLCRSAGLALSPTFIPFTPWTTWDGYRDLLHVIADHDLIENVAPIQLALRLLITNGSLLLELPEIAAIVEPFQHEALLHRWRHPDPSIDQLAERLMRLVDNSQKQAEPRARTFARIWEAAQCGVWPDIPILPSRATIPYLNEPWYC